VADLKHAFGLDDYDLDGTFSGQFKVMGEYQRPHGGGTMAITEGVAYGESFDTATARVALEGNGVRLSDIALVKGNGRGTGSAFVGWNATYSFTFNANDIALETLDVMTESKKTVPLSGLIDFSANGSGSFDRPRYDVSATIRDVFVADEGIGRVVGEISIDGEQLLLRRLEASSARLIVSGSGQITMNDARDADITFNVTDTSLDPYVRAFNPRLSPYTSAVASGTIRVYGELADIDRVIVDATVDRFDARLFDYAIRNPDDPDPDRKGQRLPIKLALDRHTVRITDMRLVGQDTQLDVTGAVNLHDETIVMRTIGNANLGLLQAFMPNVSSRGRAEVSAQLSGALRDPNVNGTMTVQGGRIRHFGLPHALDDISGVIRFDTSGVGLDGLSATLGGGAVQFGGTIGIDGYEPGRIDVTMTGQDMRLRFPEGMTSRVDADLSLIGTIQRATLRGDVTVRDAVYRGTFEAGDSFFSVGGTDAALPVSAVTGTTIPLSYDVQITAPSTLRVDNRLLRNVVASADLRLAGTYDRPLLFGNVDIEDGVLLFEGKRYEVQTGTVTFNNPTRIAPYFDIETETRVRTRGETYRVTVRAVGEDPISGLTFRSDPELPEYQILALLLSDVAPGLDVEFRPYEQNSPQARLVRDRITRGLTGVVSEEVQQVVEEALGLDTFQLNATLQDPNQQSNRLEPGARVTVGKWLSERVFLTYTRSLSSSTRDQVVVLEIDQSDQLSWILSRNEDGTYAVEMRVRRTF
jgi:translocation and assembly module TamB